MDSIIETERLFLKKISFDYFDDLYALRSDPEVMQYIDDGSVKTREQVKEFIQCGLGYYEKYGLDFFCAFEKETGHFIGQAGLFHLKFNVDQPDIELAYRLHKRYWGRGYATELTIALIGYGFNTLALKKIMAMVHPENTRSRKVLEKVGLHYQKTAEFRGLEMEFYAIYKDDAIELVPYNPEWPVLAKLEIKKIQATLPSHHILDIQHVGSTAIPGMMAKPIIDISIAVDSLPAIKQIAIDCLKALNYEYWHENPDPERMFFVKGMPPFGDKRTHHVHIVEPGSRQWQEKIQFRDYLLSHPNAAREYEHLKIHLARQYPHNREKYTNEKTEFIIEILKKING